MICCLTCCLFVIVCDLCFLDSVLRCLVLPLLTLLLAMLFCFWASFGVGTCIVFVVLLCLIGLYYDAATVFYVRLVSVVGCYLVLVCLCLAAGLTFVMWALYDCALFGFVNSVG